MNKELDLQNKNCVTCGNVFNGQYCNTCGEKVLKKEDKKIWHFFEEFIHMITHADGKFFKSLKYLFTKPGFLTTEYLSGRRKPYTSPLSLFFIANLIYFLIPTVDSLNSKYQSQIKGQVYSSSIIASVNHKMEERKWTPQQMETHYNEETSHISKVLLILIIFLFSIPVTLLFYSRKLYYFDHLIFATEFINFIIYCFLFLMPALLTIFFLLNEIIFKSNSFIDINSGIFVGIILLLITFYLTIATRRVYQKKWAYSIFASVLLTLSMACVILFYRYLLFQITLLIL